MVWRDDLKGQKNAKENVSLSISLHPDNWQEFLFVEYLEDTTRGTF